MSTNAAVAPAAQQSKSSVDAPSCSVHQKMTKAMSASLENLRSSLLCGLCNQMMKDAATLGCAHSFCYQCIARYTENKWNCPFPACNISVTSMKGNSDSYIKRNPQINDVVIALQRIEENVRMAPDRWWETGDNTAAAAANVNNDNVSKDVQEDDGDEEEIVDFAAMQHNDNDSSDDESSTTKAYEPQGEKNVLNKRNEMSIEQSLFPSDQSAEADISNLPRFSGVSTIAWKHSQMTEEESKKSPESSTSPDGPQTATASQLDRVLMLDSDQKDATKAAASSGVEIKRSVKENESDQSEKKQASKQVGKNTTPEQSENKQIPKQSAKKRKQSMAATKEDIDERKPAPKSRRTQRVSFQELPKVMLLKPSLSLKNTESRSLRKCIKDDMISMLKMQRDDIIEDDNLDTGFDFDTEDGRGQFLSLLSCSKNGHSTAVSLSCFALSTEKEYAFDEGVVVPRSFQFYLAVACGLPIVDISFLESQSKKKRLGIMNHQRYPFPTTDEKKLSKEEKATHVIGASNHNWYAPQKAISAAIERHSLWASGEGIHASSNALLPGTDLLQNFSVILIGDFDQPSVSKRVAKKKAKSNNETTSDGSRTRGNVTVLLQLCGAKVYDVASMSSPKNIKKGLTKAQLTSIASLSPMGYPEGYPTLKDAVQLCFDSKDEVKVVAMVRDKSDTKLGTDFIAQCMPYVSDPNENDVIDVISCDWLFDCIGDFQVHNS